MITESRIKELETRLALAIARARGGGGSGSGGAGGIFVWQPGGTTGVGIYTTPQSLGAALATAKGPKIVGVDISNGAADLTMAGSPYNLDDVRFVPCLGSPAILITVESGVTFTPSTTSLTLERCILQTTGGGTVWSPPGSAFLTLEVSQVLPGAGAPLLSCSALVDLSAEASIVGDGVHTAILLEAAGELEASLIASGIDDNALGQGTAPGGVALITLDASSAVGATQGAGITVTPVLQGLNAVEAFLASNSGAVSSVTVPTAGLTMERTGLVDVHGFIGGTNSAGATITVQLLRDAAVIATYPPIVQALAGNWAASLAITDILTDDTAHTYSVKAAASAGTIAVVGNGSKSLTNAFVRAQEQ
jgi:hypothetical protein